MLPASKTLNYIHSFDTLPHPITSLAREGGRNSGPRREGTLHRAWKNFDEKFLKRFFGGETHQESQQ